MKEQLIKQKYKLLGNKRNGILLSYNKTNKGCRILGARVVFKGEYRTQFALADELWYDRNTGKKYIIKKIDKRLYIGLLAIHF